VHFDTVFSRQKTRTVTRSLGRGFYGSIAKPCLQEQSKNYPKIHCQTWPDQDGRNIAPPPAPRPEYVTACSPMILPHSMSLLCLQVHVDTTPTSLYKLPALTSALRHSCYSWLFTIQCSPFSRIIANPVYLNRMLKTPNKNALNARLISCRLFECQCAKTFPLKVGAQCRLLPVRAVTTHDSHCMRSVNVTPLTSWRCPLI